MNGFLKDERNMDVLHGLLEDHVGQSSEAYFGEVLVVASHS